MGSLASASGARVSSGGRAVGSPSGCGSRQRRFGGPPHQRVEPGRRGKALLLQGRGALHQHGDLQPRLQHVLLHRLAHAVAGLGDLGQLLKALAIARGDLKRQSVIAVIKECSFGVADHRALGRRARPLFDGYVLARHFALQGELVAQRHHLHKAEAPVAGRIVVLHLEGYGIAHPGKGERRIGQNACLPNVGALCVDQGRGPAQCGIGREYLAHHVIQAKLGGRRSGNLLRQSHRRQQKQTKQLFKHESSLSKSKPMPIQAHGSQTARRRSAAVLRDQMRRVQRSDNGEAGGGAGTRLVHAQNRQSGQRGNRGNRRQ